MLSDGLDGMRMEISSYSAPLHGPCLPQGCWEAWGSDCSPSHSPCAHLDHFPSTFGVSLFDCCSLRGGAISVSPFGAIFPPSDELSIFITCFSFWSS